MHFSAFVRVAQSNLAHALWSGKFSGKNICLLFKADKATHSWTSHSTSPQCVHQALSLLYCVHSWCCTQNWVSNSISNSSQPQWCSKTYPSVYKTVTFSQQATTWSHTRSSRGLGGKAGRGGEQIGDTDIAIVSNRQSISNMYSVLCNIQEVFYMCINIYTYIYIYQSLYIKVCILTYNYKCT